MINEMLAHAFNPDRHCVHCGASQSRMELFSSTHCGDQAHVKSLRQATMQRKHSPPERPKIKPGEEITQPNTGCIGSDEWAKKIVESISKPPDEQKEAMDRIGKKLVESLQDGSLGGFEVGEATPEEVAKFAAGLQEEKPTGLQKPEGRVGYINLRAESLRQFLDLPHGVEITNATWDYRRNSIIVSLRGDELPAKCARKHPDEHITEVFPKYDEVVCYVYYGDSFETMVQKTRTSFRYFA